MSENGPREGTRDLPRPAPETGRRAVEEDSPAGVAYAALSRSLRRRRAELAERMGSGATIESVARSYEADHPFEPAVTPNEIQEAVSEATRRAAPAEQAHRRPARRGVPPGP